MSTTSNFQKAAEDVKDEVVTAIESAKTRAAETAVEIGRATRKTIHDAQGARRRRGPTPRQSKESTISGGSLPSKTADK